MANNYCETSSWLDIPLAQIEKAEEIADRVAKELEEDDEGSGCCGILYEFRNDASGCGIWFYTDESADIGHLEYIAQTLVDELKIDKPFCFSWSYACSKPRLDEFGGGACVVQRGKKAYWVDAMDFVQRYLNKEENND